jgi:tRNA-dihydrouridine synthase 3
MSEEDMINAVDTVKGEIAGESEVLDVPLRPEEKKRLNWEGGLYLAPLTTVGNLVSGLTGRD